MILADVLKAMANNENVNITLIDTDEKPLITFGAGGYASVEADITAREVKKIKIVSVTHVDMYLGDAPVPSI